MLVTIASNNDADAAHFVNHFPEGLIIPKNASIGVVNCSYVLNEGYVIQTGLNDVMEIKLGNMAAFINATIAAGSYATIDLLAGAVQTAIRTAIGTQSALIQASFPVAEQTAVGDQQSAEITIHFLFDLASQQPDFFLVGQNAFFSNLANIFGNNGGFVNNVKNAAVGAPGAAQVRTSNGVIQNFLVPTHKNTTSGSYEAVFRAEYQSVGYESQLLLKSSSAQLPSVSPIQVVFTVAGQIDIYEMIGGVRTQVNQGASTIASGNTLEIRIPEVDPTGASKAYAGYFLTAGGATAELPVIAPGAGRREISQFDEFIPAVEFTTNSVDGRVVPGIAKADAADVTNVQAGGTGYEPGDFLTQGATTGAGVGIEAIVTAVDGNGAITFFDFVATGSGYVGGEDVTMAGGNGNGAILRVGSTLDSIAVTTGGTGYVQGQVYTTAGGAGTNCTITASTVAAGVVTGVTVTAPGFGYISGDVLTLTGGGSGGNATVTIGECVAQLNRVTNVRATLIQAPTNQRPLVLDRSISFKPGTFNSLFNGHPRYNDDTGDKKITSGAMVSNNRVSNNIHIQLNDFGPIESREKNSNGKTVAIVPLGDNSNTVSGLFNNELFNIVYHKLQNPEPLSNNELSVRLTDFNSNTLPSLRHPVTITFDVRPDVI